MKRIIIPAIFLCLIAVIGWLNYNNASSQSNAYLEKKASTLGEFPVINGLLTPAFDFTFAVDTRCDLSMITPQAIEKLKAHGMSVDSTFCPVFYRDRKGKIRFTTKRYIVSMPIQRWDIRLTDDGRFFYTRPNDNTLENTMHQVNFVPSPDEVDVMGLDIMRKCVLEYKYTKGTIALHLTRPKDYKMLSPLHLERDIPSLLGCGNRYFMSINIAGRPNDFIVDSSLDLIHVKMPAEDSIFSHSALSERSVLTSNGKVIKSKINESEWAHVGDRAGLVSVNYYNDGGEDYAVNPFCFSMQDVLIDFPNEMICYHPRFDVPVRMPCNSHK